MSKIVLLTEDEIHARYCTFTHLQCYVEGVFVGDRCSALLATLQNLNLKR